MATYNGVTAIQTPDGNIFNLAVGATGATGSRGTSIFYSTQEPASSATSLTTASIALPSGYSLMIGDLVICKNGLLFRLTATSGTATYLTTLVGPQGATGPTGPTGNAIWQS